MNFLEIMGCAMINVIVLLVITLIVECIGYVIKKHKERNKLLKEIKKDIDDMKESKNDIEKV